MEVREEPRHPPQLEGQALMHSVGDGFHDVVVTPFRVAFQLGHGSQGDLMLAPTQALGQRGNNLPGQPRLAAGESDLASGQRIEPGNKPMSFHPKIRQSLWVESRGAPVPKQVIPGPQDRVIPHGFDAMDKRILLQPRTDGQDNVGHMGSEVGARGQVLQWQGRQN
jgi:hypothetical protein